MVASCTEANTLLELPTTDCVAEDGTYNDTLERLQVITKSVFNYFSREAFADIKNLAPGTSFS
jgi:hypothetical protein